MCQHYNLLVSACVLLSACSSDAGKVLDDSLGVDSFPGTGFSTEGANGFIKSSSMCQELW